jgi:predicted transcriptional regulator
LTGYHGVDISASMPDSHASDHLSRRERQVMELLIRLGSATARDVQRELPDPPTYSAVRSILRILGEKKLITKVRKDGRDLYSSPVPADKARIKALQAVVRSFFSNSAVEAACALLGNRPQELSADDVEKLQKLIDEARKK